MRIALSFLPALTLAACSLNTDGVPKDAKLTCALDTDCPPRWTCRVDLASCVPPGAGGGEGPAISGKASVVPPALGAGEVVVSFTTDIPTGADPVLTATLDTTVATFEIDKAASVPAERRWVARHTFTTEDPEGSWVLLAKLVAADGSTGNRSLGTLEIDRTPPQPPARDHLLVHFDWADPLQQGSERLVRVKGLDSALEPGGTIHLWEGVANPQPPVPQPSTTATVGEAVASATQGFGELSVRGAPALNLYASQQDRAGNESQRVALEEPAGHPGFIVFGQTVFPPTAKPMFQIGVDGAPPGSLLLPTVTIHVGGKAVEGKVKPQSPGMFTATVPDDTLLVEGPGALVVTGTFPLSAPYAGGSSFAVPTLFADVDGVPPEIDATKLAFEVTADGPTLAGAAGAVTDRLGPGQRPDMSVLMLMLAADLASGLPDHGLVGNPIPITIRADGSFGPLDVLDAQPGAIFSLSDPAGNRAPQPPPPIPADVAAPTITGLSLDPPAAHVGATVRVAFSVTDAASTLWQAPSVWIAGNPAHKVSGTPGAPGAATAFVYEGAALPTAARGDNEVLVFAQDAAGNRTYASAVLALDEELPVAVVEVPASGSRWDGAGATGTASDEGGLAMVEWTLGDPATHKFWNGSAFSATQPAWTRSTGTDLWTLPPMPALAAGRYELTVRATDIAGNVSVPVVTPFDAGGTPDPQPPSGVSAHSVGEGHIALSWRQPTQAGREIRYRAVGTSEWKVAFNTAGLESPVTAHIGPPHEDLPRGRYELCVATQRPPQDPLAPAAFGPCSRIVTASSRGWVSNNVLTLSGGAAEQLAPGGYGVWGTRRVVAMRPVTGDGTVVYAQDGDGNWTSALKRHVAGAVSQGNASMGEIGDTLVASWAWIDASGAHSLIAFSSDHGATWSRSDEATGVFPSDIVGAISRAGEPAIINVPERNPDAADKAIMMSSDGGATWTSRPMPTMSYASGLGSGSVLAVYDEQHNVQFRTSDEGLTWVTVRRSTRYGRPPAGFTSLGGTADGPVFGVGFNGLLYLIADRALRFEVLSGLTARSLERTRTGLVAITEKSGELRYRPDGGEWTTFNHPGRTFVGAADGELIWQTATSLERCVDACTVLTADTTIPFSLGQGAQWQLFPVLGEAALLTAGNGQTSSAAEFGPY